MFVINTTKNETQSQETMGNVNKAERIVEFFFFVFFKFFLNLSFCSFIFLVSKSGFSGQKNKEQKESGGKTGEGKGHQL